jgi:glycerol-3-phosphate dehydrogenase (NAD(P)+)
MHRKISVIGAGGWGTALAMLLSKNAGHVRLWAHRPAVAEEINIARTNEGFLPGIQIPSGVEASAELGAVVDGADVILLVTPSKATRDVVAQLAACRPAANAIIVSCTKGIEHDTGLLMSDIVHEYLPENPIAVLSGPNLAIEVAKGIPAAGVIGADDPSILPGLQERFSTGAFRAYTSADVRGIQLGGALKNVFAIAAGAADGFGLGDNTKAGLVTRALTEMMRLGVAMGGHRESFYGLSGVGDLMVTCFSKHSRNRKFGERLGRGESPAGIAASTLTVAEGVPTARSALQCAQKLGVEVPITERVYAVIYENESPRTAIESLLGRPPRAEADLASRRS